MQDKNGTNLSVGDKLTICGTAELIHGERELLFRPEVGNPFYVSGLTVEKVVEVQADVDTLPLSFQQRVVDEKAELDARLTKLNDFLLGSVFTTLSQDEQGRLKCQASAMEEYATVLAARIEAFNTPPVETIVEKDPTGSTPPAESPPVAEPEFTPPPLIEPELVVESAPEPFIVEPVEETLPPAPLPPAE